MKQIARKSSGRQRSFDETYKIPERDSKNWKQYKLQFFDWDPIYVVLSFNDVTVYENIQAEDILDWFNQNNRAYTVFGIHNENDDDNIEPHIAVGISYRSDDTVDVYILIGVRYGYDRRFVDDEIISDAFIQNSVRNDIIPNLGELFAVPQNDIPLSCVYLVPGTYDISNDEEGYFVGADRIHVEWEIKLLNDMDSFASSGDFLF